MFKNNLKIIFRNLLKHKVFSFINIAGLAIGMACCILLFLYVRDEFSYDTYHKKADQIYRVVGDLRKNKNSASTGPPMAPAMLNDLPPVQNAVRIAAWGKVLISYKEKRLYETGLGYASASIFEIFTFPLIKGNPEIALSEPWSIVISETMAKKYFDNEDPLGEVLIFDNEFNYTITGVMKDIPANSHIKFDFLASFTSLENLWGGMYDCWWCTMAYTYLLLPKDYPPAELEKQFPTFIENHIGPQDESGVHLRLQPLTDIHFDSGLTWEVEPGGNLTYLYILSTVGLFILLIACFNYMNLIIALSAQRAKEVGMRKVIGSSRKQLMAQFLGESIFFSVMALPIAVTLVELFLPTFNDLVGKELRIEYTGIWLVLLGLASVALIVGGLSGIYPALFLSRFQPAAVLKGEQMSSSKGVGLRSILVVIQFVFSIVLIITTIIVFAQFEYFRNKKLGFHKEQVVILPIRDKLIGEKYDILKDKLLQDPNIVKVSKSFYIPPERLSWKLAVWPGGKREEAQREMKTVFVHFDFFETLGIEVAEGRTFSKYFGTDEKQGFVLNEAAVKEFGWESAVGRKFGAARAGKKGAVIGVVKDFHFESLHQKIEPMVFIIEPWYNHIIIRIRPDKYAATLGFLRDSWEQLFSHRPFEYFFLDDSFDKLYKSEEKLGRIFGYFSALAIFIACLGLFGLVSFAAEQRTREIGIRKVLGASVSGIVSLLTKDFVKLVFVANFIAWPIALYAINKWLQDFAYRIDIGWWVFVLAGVLALLIALLTVSYLAIRAAIANPVESLRYE